MGNIVRIKKDVNYSVLDNGFIQDSNLSWKATGLLTYLLHLPNDWDISTKDLQTRKTDGRDSVRAGIDELIKAGYVEYKRVNAKGGKWEHVYFVYEEPQTGNPPMVERPQTGSPTTGNPPISEVLSEPITNKEVRSDVNKTSPQAVPYVLQNLNHTLGFNELIEEFNDLRPALKEPMGKFIAMRKTKGLSKKKLIIILEDVVEYLTDDDEAITEIGIALDGGYGQVVNDFLVDKHNRKLKEANKPPKGDNTVKGSFVDNKDVKVDLALGEDGLPLEF